MDKDAKKKYRLFALPLTNQNITLAADERFSRATPNPEPGYVLIYTDGKAPDNAEEITQERVKLLSQADERWLIDVNAALIAERIAENEPEIVRGLSESIERLEAELKRRKEEIERKGE